MKSTNTSTPAIVGAIAITAILSMSTFVFLSSTPKNQTVSKTTTSQPVSKSSAPTATQSAPTNQASSTPQSTSSNKYLDGNYNATASYSVPKGFSNDITVNLTVKNGLVSAVNSIHKYQDRESGDFVDWFDADIEAVVVGKPLADISLSRVGGASLTTDGFQNALANITNQAKA